MLIDDYLKYSPEITLEIFTLIYNKLIESGLKPVHTLGSTWREFSGKYSYLYCYNDKKLNQFNEPPKNGREITVQEILGYNPFIKNDFILPEKWCIKIQANGIPHEVAQWRKSSWSSPGYILSSGMWDCDNAIGYTEITFEQFKKYILKESIEEPKQPLKQAVHCKTQEEWDFVYDKRGHKKPNSLRGNSNCVLYTYRDNTTSNSSLEWIQMNQSDGYQILSFQEWCDLNGYKMEKEVKFEVGKWYKFKLYNNDFRTIKCSNVDDSWVYCNSFSIADSNINACSNQWALKSIKIDSIKELSIEEIQQYLPDDHPDKIKSDIKFEVGDWVVNLGKSISYSVNEICRVSKISKTHLACENKPQTEFSMKPFKCFRHATPKEINNHLISIEQIPIGEPLNTGIEPNKDGAFKYTTLPGSSWGGGTIQNHLEALIPTTGNCYNRDFATSYIPIKSKMTLSIDDEELPMVNIIKTNTIKQLLNND